MTNEIRVRYAPSPTGHLHIGNARTALFNYLYARHLGGKFIIRIEDTDEKRNVAGGEQSQMQYLKWLGIDWDESVDVGGEYGPYRQMERLDLYQKYIDELLDRNLAYKCYMTEEELEAEREGQRERGEVPMYSGAHRDLTEDQIKQFEAEGRQPSIRIRVPEGVTYKWNDLVRGEITFDSSDFGDWVIAKKNGTPTYNFAVAVDDYLMKITDVLRGEEHISNTPKQMMVYDALGWEAPRFGHMALILNEQRKKLSKRDEHILQFIGQYEQLGYLPESLFNFITLLGWSPVGEEEIFTSDQLIEIFDSNRLSSSPAVFDPQKLKWINNQYIKAADLDRVVELALPHLVEAGRLPEDMNDEQRTWARELIALYQEQLNYSAEIVELTELFFKEEIDYDEEAMAVLKEEQVPEVLETYSQKLDDLEAFEPDAIKKAVKAVQKETGHKGKKLFMPIRVATTGQTHGPELPNAIHLLGKDTVQKRLKNAVEQLQA
ncbi:MULTISPECIES: glutamate--tRNA ligase [Pontibacillus]|uniref:Glutamate--tRNA ligase n=1 Tax=Pontibacillus chungwhensis TaxID=265426 RepID=A0ABY8UYF5_9BACI|nr:MULTISPECIES: glutamate--tRNA ligase [Pontibacillus]MCD5326064.1 glutamate--tRNA ligase [Pontibacillus sp. HN14]WIF98233.1 glutamate--tRNA ligase [Pontibacillus chungwhensis]